MFTVDLDNYGTAGIESTSKDVKVCSERTILPQNL